MEENDKKVVRVLLGIPNEGHTEPEAYDNRIEMGIHLGSLQVLSSLGLTKYCGVTYDIPTGVEYQFNLGVVGQVFTALAREKLAEYAVESGCDYLFMIDDDMLSPRDLFEQLVKHDVDVIAPLAFTRNPPHKPVIYNLEKGYDPVGGSYFINHPVLNYKKGALLKCDAVGFGAVLIKTSVLKQMKAPWFMSTSGAGEDIYFCHKAIESGFGVFMDTSVKLGHLGYPKVITEETYEFENNVKELRETYGDGEESRNHNSNI